MSKNNLLASFLTLLFFSIILTQINCNQNEKKEMTKEEMQKRGEYLVTLGGCNHCHSSKVFTEMGPVPDTTKLLSGHPAGSKLASIDTSMVQPGKWILTSSDLTAWVGPWGISYAANLTPDEPTGIGTWTDEVFIKALRTGKHMGIGRPILPPMPWPDIAKATDEDLKAIFSYLKSLPPIRNQVPDPVPPNQLSTLK
jgi:mono/diheme cytochrome c family protein